ncbi:hypothetical protein CGRA01v4_03845 [Colletotrichum graminicola]|nr:hypothetical protein CGRA01v4_03845 [Colletotrichum graminicola]
MLMGDEEWKTAEVDRMGCGGGYIREQEGGRGDGSLDRSTASLEERRKLL